MTTSAGTFYYHPDTIGTEANLTSSAGATQWTYEHEPFGVVKTETSASGAPTNVMRFVGEQLDATGLYHLRARQYDPTTGRFLTPDPLKAASGSTYAYADDRPTALVDPSGESAQGVIQTLWGTVKEVPHTIDRAVHEPALFIGSAASYTVFLGINYGAVRALVACLAAETKFLDLLGKIDHPGSCSAGAVYVSGTSLPFGWAGYEASKALANIETQDQRVGQPTK